MQNAVDATFIRVCLEYKDKITNDEIGYEKFKNIFNPDAGDLDNDKYAIEVSLKKYGSGWHFTIADHGVGMSKNDLTYLLKIGSSTQNVERKKIIDSMPEFAKPSGVFGIGFQSVFLLTEKVTLRTRRFDDGDCLKVELNSPLKSGFVALRTSEGRFKPYGTIIDFEITNTSLFKRNVKGYNKEFKTRNGNYDFIENTEDELFAACVQDEIAFFSYNTIIPIYFNGKLMSKRKEYAFYKDENTGLFIEISPVTKEDLLFRDDATFSSENMVVSYRGSIVEHLKFVNSIKFIPLNINILSGLASEILQVDRDSFKDEYEFKLIKIIERIGVRFLSETFDEIPNDDFKLRASMFLEYYSNDNQHKEWKKIPICKGISLGSFIDSKKELVISSYNVDVQMEDKIQLDFNDPKTDLLTCVLRRNGYKIKFDAVKSMFDSLSPVFIFSSYEKNDQLEWKSWLQLYKQRNSVRSLMPCIGFEKLQIDKRKIIGVRLGRDPMNMFEKIDYPQTVCPVVVNENGDLKWSVSDKLYQCVFDNQIEEKQVPLNKIKELYGEMKKKFDPIIAELNG